MMFKSFALAALATQSLSEASQLRTKRHLQFNQIAGYVPGSKVTDHNAIDLDQKAIEGALDGTNTGFSTALAVYAEGGYSKSYARIRLSSGAPSAIASGTAVTGTSSSGATVTGKVLSAVAAGATTVDVQYDTSTNQVNYVNCQVGGLPSSLVNTVGCLASTGSVTISGSSLSYTYNQLTGNLNARTIQGFSTAAEEKMLTCSPGCPYPDFQKFFNYYGVADYADKWVVASLNGGSTSFSNGNADFSSGTGLEPTLRIETAKKGTAYMAVWMYVVREFEDALDDCQVGCIDCNDDPVHAWDEGVAFYTGSSHGPNEDSTSSGYLMYSLANKRCANFKTCGLTNDQTSGNSHVNIRLSELFEQGKTQLQNGQCDSARRTKEDIVKLMAVPATQGTLRYAHVIGQENINTPKAIGEGAVFAASVLPIVHACSASDARIIYNNMRVGATSTSLAAVKQAFERNYACMGFTCADVGGYFDSNSNQYFNGASPCTDANPFDMIAGYVPGSQVTDHNAIDLDQQAIESALTMPNGFVLARQIYQEGGFSKSFARITLSSPLPSNIAKGTEIDGFSPASQPVQGKALNDYSAGTTIVDVQYVTSDRQDTYVDCQVGGLPSSMTNTDGCLTSAGSVTIGGQSFSYSYNPATQNLNGRTIQGFSTQAEDKMLNCGAGCPYTDFAKFNNYYGSADYADRFVQAAFDKSGSGLTRGNFDFSSGLASQDPFRLDFIKKVTAYQAVWMYVIREFEDALDDCQVGCIDCNDDPVHAWDEGVAFYTGSLHGPDSGTTSSGAMIYSLANKRCANFKTCGQSGTDESGNANVNVRLFQLFDIGKNQLQNGQCANARVTKESVAKLMAIPSIQGTLRYAYVAGIQGNRAAKAMGELAAFAAAVLPIVHACSPSDAQTIYNNIRSTASSTDHEAVKTAFENNYACMGLKCSDIGGYWDSATQSYLAQPCTDFSFVPVCFSGSASVQLESGVKVAMKDLRIGDRVQTSKDGVFDTVYSFGHSQPDVAAEFLRFKTTAKVAPIEISPSHMLFDENNKAMPASSVRVGDILLGGDAVTNIDTITGKGAFAPFTYSGTVVVNGVVASSYVSLTGSNTFLGMDMQFVAHTALAPRRLMCKLGFCDIETYEDGVATWIPWKLATWMADSEGTVAAMLMAVGFVVAYFLSVKRSKNI